MAKPHGKTLRGKEAGNKSQHWYDFIESKAKILRSKRWDGGCPASKPGATYATWLGFDEFGKPQWGSLS